MRLSLLPTRSNNYGGAGAIAVSAAGLPKGEMQSLMRFDLSGAMTSFDAMFGVGNWILESATLQLTAANPNNALFNASAAGQISAGWMQNDGWTEGAGTPMAPGAIGITWSNLPSFLSATDESMGAFNFSGATSGTATYSLTLTPGFNSDTASGGLVSIRLWAGDSAVSGLFNSRSNTVATSRPLLILEAVAVPEPATWILASCGLVGILRRSGVARLSSRVR